MSAGDAGSGGGAGAAAGIGADRLLDGADGGGAVAAATGVMLFLTVLAAALCLSARGAAQRMEQQLAGRLTVQVVDGNAARRDRAAAAALAVLAARPDVRAARPVPEAELRALLSEWAGDGADGEAALPLPAMIEAELADPAAAAAVSAAVRARAPDARVDAQGDWMAPVSRVARGAAMLGAAAAGLAAAAALAVVALGARAGVAANRSTLEVMHLLGATDAQVARLFARRAAWLALAGGGAGGLAGLAVARLAGAEVARLGSGAMGDARLGAADWLALALLPVAFAALAALTARVAVLVRLGRRT